MRRSSFAAAWSLLLLTHCHKDLCRDEPAGFVLEVQVDATTAPKVRSLEVEVDVGQMQLPATVDVGSALGDGTTTLGLKLPDPPTQPFTMTLIVRAHDALGGGGAVLAEATQTFSATPDLCNRFSMTLGTPGPEDGGADGGDAAEDARPDAADGGSEELGPGDMGPQDIGPDTGPEDRGPSDNGPVEIGPSDTGDGGMPEVGPAETGPAETGPGDIGPPDSGVTFPYAPSNFDPNALGVTGPNVLLNCGETIFDSTMRTFTNLCGAAPPTRLQAQPGGPEAVVIVTGDFTIAGGGNSLRIVGSRPVIVAVFGDATIGGRIHASANLATPGPGGSDMSSCLVGTGDDGTGGSPGSGGGGAGALGDGAFGGTAIGAFGAGPGTTSGSAMLVPLRGGCTGGHGGVFGGVGGGAGGGGGGALQISASGELRLTGVIVAGGGGGQGGEVNGGGGGGGSGGTVLLEGDRAALTSSSVVAALGGGGGEGGADSAAGLAVSGGNGDLTAGAGGVGHDDGGGTGGMGAGTGAPVRGGDASGYGGGGGGGAAAGFIRVNAFTSCSVQGSLQPTFTTNSPPGGC